MTTSINSIGVEKLLPYLNNLNNICPSCYCKFEEDNSCVCDPKGQDIEILKKRCKTPEEVRELVQKEIESIRDGLIKLKET